MKTAVEWFAEITAQLGYVSTDTLEQAKQMEKEQIEKAYFTGSDRIGYCSYSDEYYNETYGKK